MRIFTIRSGKVIEGAQVESFILKGAGVTIPVVAVGESGRGRRLAIMPVKLLEDTFAEWSAEGSTQIKYAVIGKTRSGYPKLIEVAEPTTDDKALVVFRTMIGYRGSNEHSGDLKKWQCKQCKGEGSVVDLDESGRCPKCGYYVVQYVWDPFPGEVLVSGIIAQGGAGRMGSGRQLIAIVPRDVVFVTRYSGRLYGAPSAHFYLFDGEKITSVTLQERLVADLWF